MTEADRISEFARVDHELAELVVMGATRGGHSLRAFRGSSNAPIYVRDRQWVIRQASAKFTSSQIGRALNRDHSTILHHCRQLGVRTAGRQGISDLCT